MKDFELIDKYFENSLAPKEQLEFNQLLQNDEEFKGEFLFRKDLKNAVRQSDYEHLKSQLQDFEENNKPKVIPLYKKWWAIASVLIVAILSAWFIQYSFPSTSSLYETHYTPYRNVVLPISRGDSEQSVRYSAFVAYEQKNYSKALHLFTDAPGLSTDTASFYQAMCYLSLNKPKQAIELLKPIADSPSHGEIDNLNELSNWYLGLAYLKLEDERNAKLVFENYLENDQYHYQIDQVKDILVQLK